MKYKCIIQYNLLANHDLHFNITDAIAPVKPHNVIIE